MSNLIAILVVLALLVFFPAFLFILLVRAIRIQGMRWWGIVILLSLLTCYCTTMTAVVGLIVGGNATGSAALDQHYCEAFVETLTQTETLPEAIARMDAAAATDEYQVREPDKNLRFRYVWLLGGCFLFAGANLMMFAPGRREKRHPADCIMMIVAALVVFLTGIWQIAWGNGYAYQASAYRRRLTEWHKTIPPDAALASNAKLAGRLFGEVKAYRVGLSTLSKRLCAISAELEGSSGLPELPAPDETEKTEDEAVPADAGTGPGVAIIGGADGPTAVFINSELRKKQSGAPSENAEETAPSVETADSGQKNPVSDL
jgi:hypothetical protein